MSSPTATLLPRLEASVAELGSVAVGLSGGVDSSLLAAVTHRVLGDRSVAVVARSASLPQRELAEARTIAGTIGIDLEVVTTAEVADPRYAANPRNRCRFCKDHQFAALRQVADQRGFTHIAHGEVVDDLDDHRPGRAAAEEWNVRAPLREAGLTKDDVRALAQALDLPVWDKPAFACLASRIPTGLEVTPERLAQVERAEAHLHELGFRAFRVRHHDTLARIELPVADHPRALELAAEVERGVRAAGFEHVTLDLGGLDASKGVVEVGRPLPLVLPDAATGNGGAGEPAGGADGGAREAAGGADGGAREAAGGADGGAREAAGGADSGAREAAGGADSGAREAAGGADSGAREAAGGADGGARGGFATDVSRPVHGSRPTATDPGRRGGFAPDTARPVHGRRPDADEEPADGRWSA